MQRVRTFWIRILNLFRKSKLDSDLREQLEAHREMIKADLIGRGIEPSEAERAATERSKLIAEADDWGAGKRAERIRRQSPSLDRSIWRRRPSLLRRPERASQS